MDEVQNYLKNKKDILQLELLRIQTMNDVYNWFIDISNIKYSHKDIKSNISTIILSTSDDILLIDKNLLEVSFNKTTFYNNSKSFLITIGYIYTKHNNKNHIIIQDNSDIKKGDFKNIKDSIMIRIQNELFPHIDQYFNI